MVTQFGYPIGGDWAHLSTLKAAAGLADAGNLSEQRAWAAANTMFGVRVWNPVAFDCDLAWWANGGTISGNLKIAVYDEAFNLIGDTGSVAQSGANTLQTNALSLTIPAGWVGIAMVCDGTTGQYRTASVTEASELQYYNAWQEASAFSTVPDPATPANPSSFAFAAPAFGIIANFP